MPTGDEPLSSLLLYRELLTMVRCHVELHKKCLGAYMLINKPATAASHNLITTSDQIPTDATSQVLADTENARNDRLEQLANAAACCTRCKLAQGRTQVVFGSGPVRARLVIIGEAPGFHEDKEGKPFVGEAGQLLTKMLAAISLRREDVYICNVLKCRPPENRDPAPDEIVACRDWLVSQLALLRPKLLLAMGKFASQVLTGITQPMGRFRGHVYEYQSIPVMCTYHPAYLLRSPEEKVKAWEDLQKVRQFLDTH
jgi:DNA polymerase